MISFLRKERDLSDLCLKRQLFPILDNPLRLDRRASRESQKKQAATYCKPRPCGHYLLVTHLVNG